MLSLQSSALPEQDPVDGEPPAHGEAHRRQCLEALALFGLDAADD